MDFSFFFRVGFVMCFGMQNVTTQKVFEKLDLDLIEYPKTTKTCSKRTGSHTTSTENSRYECENIN